MEARTVPPQQRRWRRWGLVLLLGVLLGAIECLLTLGWIWLQHRQFAGTLFVVLSLSCYVVLPAVEEFVAADPRGSGAFAAVRGLFVGSIGFLALALAVVGVLLFMPPTAQSSCPQGETCPMYQGAGIVFLIVFLMFEGLAAAMGGVFGGLLGDALGLMYGARSRQYEAATAGEALAGGDASERAR